MLRRRPDIRQAERLVAAQSARIGIAESELYPHFGLNGVLEWQSQNGSNLFTADSLAGSVGPTFVWNILNYGRLQNGIAVERGKFEELVYTYQQTVLTAAREAEDAISGYLTWQDQEINLREGVKALAEAQGLCQLEAQQGGKDYNRLYVVLLEKTRQDNQWVDSKGQICQSLIQIYQALGGGWEIRLQGAASRSPQAAAPNTPAAAPNTPAAAPNIPAAGTNIPVAAENIPVPAADKPAGVQP